MDEFKEIPEVTQAVNSRSDLKFYLAGALEAIKDNIYFNLGHLSKEDYLKNNQQYIGTCHPEDLEVCSHCIAEGIISRLENHI